MSDEYREISKADFDAAVRNGRIRTPLAEGDPYRAVYRPHKRAFGVLDGSPVWCWITEPDPSPSPLNFPLELAQELQS